MFLSSEITVSGYRSHRSEMIPRKVGRLNTIPCRKLVTLPCVARTSLMLDSTSESLETVLCNQIPFILDP